MVNVQYNYILEKKQILQHDTKYHSKLLFITGVPLAIKVLSFVHNES